MTGRKELGISTHAWGEASVYAVAVEMVRRGYRVFKPLVDDGVDLLVLSDDDNHSARIQVKSASLGTRTKKGRENPSAPYYDFSLTSVKANYSQGVVTRKREFSKEVDFVILHGVEDNLYWIVPAGLADNKSSISISHAPKSKDVDWESLKTRRDSGESYRSIGDSVGLTASAIWERLNGISKDAGLDVTREIKSTQGRWEIIAQFFNYKVAE